MSSPRERVQKILCNSGYCSRRDAEDLIEQGRVTVNGEKISLGDKASKRDTILVDGKKIQKERSTYLLFNKPKGCVTALNDPKYKTVMDFIKLKERLFPVGRLDYNTTGLLLLTNDGDFADAVMHPRHRVRKTYLVQINDRISKRDVKLIQRGVNLDDGMTSPAKVFVHTPQLIEITIHEGRNRIIRRIFEKLGYKTRTLHRVKIGKLELGSLKPGRYRSLRAKEKELIFK